MEEEPRSHFSEPVFVIVGVVVNLTSAGGSSSVIT